ncbi:MAG TPA: VWA domain-containing protein [Terriglobales bacterium]|nr:VWA domain-containing protein [Terriglobales bacterium]
MVCLSLAVWAQEGTNSQPDANAPAGSTGSSASPTSTVQPQSAQQKVTPPPPKALPLDSTYNEVHIKPLVDPDKPALKGPGAPPIPNVPTPAELDPSLKTHTKPYKVEVDLVLVPVTVTDPMNRLVTGLEKNNFIVEDNGKEQQIRHFSSEDAPISLGVIFDMSGSMKDKIEKAREAVVDFFKTANPQDEFFMVAFNEKPVLLSDFTSSIESIQGQLIYAEPHGRTALLDSIYLALSKMREAHNQKKALLIISDGGDNHSRYTESEIKSIVKEADVQIYAIGIFSSNPGTIEEQTGPATLSAITDVTGGRTFTVDNPNELSDIATKIGIELRNQYVIGYRPSTPVKDGKWRKIKVKLHPPKGLPPLTVYAKSGYYAPSE